MLAGDMLSARTPSPIRASAASGPPAISPQTDSSIGEAAQGRYVTRVRDHRRHDLHRPFDRGAIARAELRDENLGLPVRKTQRANTEERVRLVFEWEIRDRFVAADVEQADRHR